MVLRMIVDDNENDDDQDDRDADKYDYVQGTTASRPTKGCGEKSYQVARNPTTWKES